jgi:hypothetical protein
VTDTEIDEQIAAQQAVDVLSWGGKSGGRCDGGSQFAVRAGPGRNRQVEHITSFSENWKWPASDRPLCIRKDDSSKPH